MYTRQKTSSSTYEVRNKKRKRDQIFLKKNQLSGKKASIGIILGVSLTLVTIALQCVAFFTPHWKEVSPNTHSLYVDGIDALIRTEVLHYFNSVHRYTRHSYGLFERCEYLLSNSSKYSNHRDDLFDINISNRQKTCTKNFLPSYRDEACHIIVFVQKKVKKFLILVMIIFVQHLIYLLHVQLSLHHTPVIVIIHHMSKHVMCLEY
jgi:hypothetical protein